MCGDSSEFNHVIDEITLQNTKTASKQTGPNFSLVKERKKCLISRTSANQTTMANVTAMEELLWKHKARGPDTLY